MRIAILLLALTTGAACAQSSQSKRFYDATGRSVGTSSTDSQGTTTIYDSRGNVLGKESKSGNSTTLYDAAGRKLGTSR